MQLKKHFPIILASLFWLFIWQVASHLFAHTPVSILIVSPIQVVIHLWHQLATSAFWFAVFTSTLRILTGYAIGLISALILAYLSHRSKLIHLLLKPLMTTIKTIPVASFIILVLIFFNTQQLVLIISMLMVLPIFYVQILHGRQAVDPQLLEMAQIFACSRINRWRYILCPELKTHFMAASTVALGLVWKAGIAAEVIGLVSGSIGEKLQQSKLYFDMLDLFSWTIVILILSALSEWMISKLWKTCFNLITKAPPKNRKIHTRQTQKSTLPTCIQFISVYKQYDEQPVLENLQLNIPIGATRVLMGESGVGKTTLTKLLLNLIQPTQGRIEGLETLDKSAVFQEDRLCESLSVWTNLKMVCPNLSFSEAEKALSKVGLGGICDQIVQTLSGGMKRRVSLIRGCLAEADCYILDEPFKGLDVETKRQVIQFVKQQLRDKTVLLITHDHQEAACFCLPENIIHLDRLKPGVPTSPSLDE